MINKMYNIRTSTENIMLGLTLGFFTKNVLDYTIPKFTIDIHFNTKFVNILSAIVVSICAVKYFNNY